MGPHYGPLWSLAVEEHFYILWPTVVDKATPRRLALILAVIIVLTPVLRATSFSLDHRTGLDWYTWFVADGLAAGSLTHRASHWDLEEAAWNLCWILLASAVVLHGWKSSWHYDA